MIGVDLAAATIALFQVASEVRRPAGFDIPQRPQLTGPQAITQACAIHGAVEAEDAERTQACPPLPASRPLGERSEALHELVERVGEGDSHLTRQMGVDLGGTRAAVPQVVLDDAQVDAGLQQVGGGDCCG